MSTKTLRNGFVVSDGSPNQVNPGCNQMATNTFGSGAAPSAAERAVEGMKQYADFQKQNAEILTFAMEREKQRREGERRQRQERRMLRPDQIS